VRYDEVHERRKGLSYRAIEELNKFKEAEEFLTLTSEVVLRQVRWLRKNRKKVEA